MCLSWFKKKEQIVLPKPPVEEPAGAWFTFRVYYNGVIISNYELLNIPLGKKVNFEIRGFDVKNKPVAMDGTQVAWMDSCKNLVFDSASGLLNSITLDKASAPLIVIVKYLNRYSFSWRLTADQDYVDPVCNNKRV